MSKAPNTRFHKELFASSGGRHDTMVARVIRDLKPILEAAYNKPDITFDETTPRVIGKVEVPETWRALDGYPRWTGVPSCSDLTLHYRFTDSWQDEPGIAYSVEKPIFNGNFLIGWIDIFATIDYAIHGKYEKVSMDDLRVDAFPEQWYRHEGYDRIYASRDESKQINESIWKQSTDLYNDNDSAVPNFITNKKDRREVIIELKPELKDIGSIIRQLKTYHQFCEVVRQRHPYTIISKASMLVLTYDALSEEYRPMFDNENITVVTLDE